MKNKRTLSVVILSKNEEENIAECIKSVDFADEVVVVDDNSIDKTRQISQNLGVKVFTRSLQDDFASQRNFGLEKAKGEWVLFIDADERVPEALASEINNLQLTNNNNGYYINRRDVLWGREMKHGEVGDVKLMRLAKKRAGKWERRVHEYWNIGGEVGELSNPLLHYPHKSLHEFIESVNRFSTLHAKAHPAEGKGTNLLKIVFWPVLKFVDGYIIKLGFLDGEQGLILGIMMSFHSFLAWSKQWTSEKKK